jgi:hypothetical protein
LYLLLPLGPVNTANSNNAASGCVINVGVGIPKIGSEVAPVITINPLIGGNISTITVEELLVNGSMYWVYGAVIDGAGFATLAANSTRDIYSVTFPASAGGRIPRLVHSQNSNEIVEFDLFWPGAVAPVVNPLRFYTGGNIDLDNGDGEIWVESLSPLPITLKSFDAIKHSASSAKLDWITSKEVNSDYFGIERSIDGSTWDEIARVKAAGDSNVDIAYDYIDDRLPLSRTNGQVFYYRLRMTDLDGAFKYSDVRGVNFDKQALGPISIYPNPTTEIVNIDLSEVVMEDGDVYVSVYDMSGRLVMTKQIIGSGIELIKVDQLPSDAYNFIIRQGEQIHQQRVIKID